ncbi:hypothetical protein ACN26Y_08115 [Micromonospora sp. WMMD558]|uniref:hypothetical protein n=1 Tax=unclassified Micromonospora TaxID=2617518 RepID=UPI0012B49562|nr:hypothetical protein [Micromonospora sp. WMMC415]QGN46248.1 hypothetical protein GKC29_04905 [Micromonospora sp. WMMC415]
MFRPFRRNAALGSYRMRSRPVPTGVPGATVPDPVPARSTVPPAWATWPTVALPRPGRAGWLTPAQTWRANGGRW